MEELIPGHKYAVAHFDNPEDSTIIQFIHKDVSDKTGELETITDGTTNEELIKVLITRLTYLDNKFPSNFNRASIKALNAALRNLERRTKDRVERGVEGKHEE
jgi:hypothetical protein